MLTYVPLAEAQDIAGDSMISINFFHEAVISISSHLFNMLLQHLTALFMLSFSMMLSAAADIPNCVPISFQQVAYCGVMCWQRSFHNGVLVTVI